MAVLGAILIFAALVWLPEFLVNRKVDNYDMNKVSIGKMAMDSHLNEAQKRANVAAGKYDKDDEWIR